MPCRHARTSAATVAAAVSLFLLVILMALRIPASAGYTENDKGGSAAQAQGRQDNGKGEQAAETKESEKAAAAEAAKSDSGKSEAAKPEAAKSGSGKSEAAKAHGKPEPASTMSPQPKSNADMNPGGANNGGDCGAYCSTRDGSPSGNGNGGGGANGKPCAGCVGKADNKNPPGQAPDGSDHNNGYECDGNSGIAKTNPAHTGCKPQPTTPPCVPSAANNNCTPPCVPTETEPCVVPTVLPTVITTPVVTPPVVTPAVKGVKIVKPQAKPGTRVLGTRLPNTGGAAPVGLLLLIGFGMLAAGVSVAVASPAKN